METLAPKETARLRVRGLDSIRFVSALWVVFCHIGVPPLLALLQWIGLDRIANGQIYSSLSTLMGHSFIGPAAVIVFFVISGFCIHFPYRHGEPVSLRSFYVRRLVRIGVPLIVMLVITQCARINHALFDVGILWSLIAEVIYYLLYPLLNRFAKRIGWKRMVLLGYGAATCLLALHPNVQTYAELGHGWTWLLGLPCWLLGCLLADRHDELKAQTTVGIPVLRLMVWVASILSFVLLVDLPFIRVGYPWSLSFFALVVYGWLSQEIVHFRLKSPGFLERLGVWSYSLYLTHLPVKELVSRWFGLNDSPLSWLYNVLAVLSFAYLFYLLIEKPSHSLSILLSKRRGSSNHV